MFRWGVLSTAKIAREHLIPAMQESTNGIVAGIASRSTERAKELASRFAVPTVFETYDDLITSADIDGVYIPLPTSQHSEWAIKAARAGKHVLCEKPIALNAKEIDDIIQARDQSGVLVSEAFMVTYHPQWLKVRALLKDGAIGKLRHVQGAFSYFNMDPNNMRNVANLGGGALPDIGVYPTVTTRFVTEQEPVRLRAEIDFSKEFGTDTFANVTAEFPDFSMSFYVSTQLAMRQEMTFHGDKGRIHLQAPFNAGLYDLARVNVFDNETDSETSFKFSAVRQYVTEVEAFVNAVHDRTLPHFTLENSRKNQAFIDAIYRAAKSGDWETV
ncbi:oxidoreductase [Amylibacter kogurei]|uniref:Oxidoreductase n=1 Tax=Paramylibacter kogurei TaxID=1889778 RepID=A0A2G5KE23_9RHOB|nr:Gfo/Idh/MocA family oxidoreductase [Amylibacter kogurei]PIB26864.1 oxidoreductase [Amylibacter kogurei]